MCFGQIKRKEDGMDKEVEKWWKEYHKNNEFHITGAALDAWNASASRYEELVKAAEAIIDDNPWESDEYGTRCFFCLVDKNYEYGGTGPQDFVNRTIHEKDCRYIAIRQALAHLRGE